MRTLLIIPALIIVYISINVYPSFAYEDPGLERQKHRQAISALDEEASRLAQELVVLDLKEKKAREESELIKKELENTRIRKNNAAFEYERALEAKKSGLKKMGYWVNFHYRYGYWSLVDVVFGAGSLGDLVNRSLMVAIILGRQSKDYLQAVDSCTAARQREEALREAENQLNSQSKSLAGQIDNIAQLAEQRKEFLAGIKRSSRELALKVASLERKLLDSINLVEFLTGALAKFSWQELEPDRVSFNTGGILVELSETTLNRALQGTGDQDLQGLSVQLKEDLFILTGKDKNSSSTFTLQGLLVPSEASGAVRIDLKLLSLDGIPVTGEVLREVAGNSGFYLPIPEGMRQFEPSRIEIFDGKMGITLRFG
ncbi:MAG: coiled-coil domain-containing protein [Bacillota bacterium]